MEQVTGDEVVLHYAGRDVDFELEDIKEITFETVSKFNSFLYDFYKSNDKNYETVYLFTSDWSVDEEDNDITYTSMQEIFVSSCAYDIYNFASKIMRDYSGCNVFLQEYRSFEDAYKVALDMREEHNLCYN